MVGFFKSLQSVFSGILADLPDGVRIVTEFVWRVRWFLLVGWLGFSAVNHSASLDNRFGHKMLAVCYGVIIFGLWFSMYLDMTTR